MSNRWAAKVWGVAFLCREHGGFDEVSQGVKIVGAFLSDGGYATGGFLAERDPTSAARP